MADIGATLREARIRAKIDINEVETRTKIRAKYLRALENEEWDLLPGDVYVRSFLRTYGDFLGLDSRQLIDEFKRRYERPPDHELRPITPRSRERERRSRGPRLPPWALIGAVLVAVVVALYFVGRKPGTGNTPSTPTAASHNGTRQRRHHARRGSRTAVARTGPAVVRPRTVKLQLVPTSAVWICLVDASGKPLIPARTYQPGETIPTETSSSMKITLGNASVKMTVNGKVVSVPPSATAVGYLLTPRRQSPLSAAQQPQCT